MIKYLQTILLVLIQRLLIFLPKAADQDRLSGHLFANRSEVIAKNGMAPTTHPLATQVALHILKAGGSAVDAAIAANALLGFADPAMNGPGGDLFAIIWSEIGRASCRDRAAISA